MKTPKIAISALLALLALTGCGGVDTATSEPPASPVSYENEPVATWQDMDSDGTRDTLVSFNGDGCAMAAYFYDTEARYTGYRVEAGTMCESAESITKILEDFINENGGI